MLIFFVYLNLWLIVKIYLKSGNHEAVFHQANPGEILLHVFLDYLFTISIIVIDSLRVNLPGKSHHQLVCNIIEMHLLMGQIC